MLVAGTRLGAYEIVDSFAADKPREWAPRGSLPAIGPFRTYDLHPDGRRLATTKAAPPPMRDHLTLMSNFFDLVRTAR
jgi:hypothetical protein